MKRVGNCGGKVIANRLSFSPFFSLNEGPGHGRKKDQGSNIKRKKLISLSRRKKYKVEKDDGHAVDFWAETVTFTLKQKQT